MRITPENVASVERLREHIPPDDIYLYTTYLIEKMSDVMHTIYDNDTEFYTDLCLEDPQILAFLNILATYEKLLSME